MALACLHGCRSFPAVRWWRPEIRTPLRRCRYLSTAYKAHRSRLACFPTPMGAGLFPGCQSDIIAVCLTCTDTATKARDRLDKDISQFPLQAPQASPCGRRSCVRVPMCHRQGLHLILHARGWSACAAVTWRPSFRAVTAGRSGLCGLSAPNRRLTGRGNLHLFARYLCLQPQEICSGARGWSRTSIAGLGHASRGLSLSN